MLCALCLSLIILYCTVLYFIFMLKYKCCTDDVNDCSCIQNFVYSILIISCSYIMYNFCNYSTVDRGRATSKVHGIEIWRGMRLTLGCRWARFSEAMVVDDDENIVHVGIYFLKSDQLCLIKANVKL